MSNDHFRQSGDLPVSSSVEEWLSRQAAEEDISREQLFGRLVSSYWTLNEMEQLLGGLDEGERPVERPSGDESVGGDDEAHERLTELEEAVEAEVERRQSLDVLVEMTADRLTDVEETVDELSLEVETVRESLDRKHESVAERADELQEELDHERDTRASEQQMLAAEQDRIGSRLDSEFENLETILTYLVSRTDELEADVSDVDSRQEEALMRLRWERDALNSIKRDAADANVRSGECESCGETIDLGLLSQPYCPACESTLTGVTEEEKWLFFSDVVVTTKSQPRKRSGRDSGQPFPQTVGSRSDGEGERSPKQPDESGSDRSIGQTGDRFTGTPPDPASNTAGSDPTADRTPIESEESGSADDDDDTGWAGSGFENPIISDDPADDVSERHGRTEKGTPSTSAGHGDRNGPQAAGKGDEPGASEAGDGSDTMESPFGDLTDLTDAE